MTTTAAAVDALTVVFASTAAACPPPSRGTTVVVLDTAWTPDPGGRPDVLSVRPYLGRAVEQHDLFEEALSLLDDWATRSGLPDQLLVDGVTYWFRMRETMWRWLHERLLWRYAIGELLGGDDHVVCSAPFHETALVDVLGWLGADVIVGPPAVAEPSSGSGSAVDRPTRTEAHRVATFLNRVLVRLGLRIPAAAPRALELGRRNALLDDRLARLTQVGGPRLVVLTTPATYTRIGAGDGSVQGDPYFAAVIPGLVQVGIEPILFGLGLNHGSDDEWPAVERNERLVPQSLLRTRWSAATDEAGAAAAVEACNAALDAARAVPLDIGGLDIAVPISTALRSALSRTIATDVRQGARIGRLIAELKPDAILLAQEWIRLPWLVSARTAGLPVFAAQHGVLYRTHPGYPDFRHPALVMPNTTFVYGDFSRRVLLEGAYHEADVVVSGSPRLDLDGGLDATLEEPDARAAERASVRRELGIAPSDRLLVVSTLHLEFVRRSHLAHMIERVLGAPLPGVHLVFKQHPGERDEGPYRALVNGLARAGGYRAPSMSVVRDIDLYRLLRSADAHLGLHSTVLTDAVAAGTPNLIAIVEQHVDLLGYVAAGVAHPVRDAADLLAALADPGRPEPALRRAFLDDHFRPGDASGRIVDTIRDRLG